VRILLANLLWTGACIPGWLRFQWALRRPQAAQRTLRKHLLRSLRGAARTERAGLESARRAGAWERMPISTWRDYAAFVPAIARGELSQLCSSPVRILEPTSGSTTNTKLIPYTDALQREFRAAIDPWILSLFLQRPGLLLTRQYWSVSPTTSCDALPDCAVPIGFEDDAAYLGAVGRWVRSTLFTAPSWLRHVQDASAHELLTLLCLVRDRRLGLISVWHPSMLELLLAALLDRRAALADCLRTGHLPADAALTETQRACFEAAHPPDPSRAEQFERALAPGGPGPAALWPRLAVISCWDEGRASSGAAALRERFPRVWVQGKGLLATEGVVTIPLGDAKVCAVRSHVLEFREANSEDVQPLESLVRGGEYEVLMSTGGGLVRYRLGDRVRCTGFVGRTPTLRFLGRLGGGCDLVGEKLEPAVVEQALQELEDDGPLAFAMLTPADDQRGYVLWFEGQPCQEPEAMARRLDGALCAGYHYAHARRLGQLRAIEARPVSGASTRYRDALVARGVKAGDIKQTPLHPATFWTEVFMPARRRAQESR